jgi:hypothetical protein
MRKLDLAAALALTVLATASAARIESPGDRRLTFEVFLDERPIGTQRFALRETPDGLRVETRAELALELLRVRVFAYDHENVEQWRDGCLHSIRARTNSNGTPYRVSGSALAGGFRVESNTGEQRLDACVGTFSYWDKDQLLRRARLLNAQTGEYVPVSVRPLGTGRIALGGGEVAVERYALEGKDLSITLAYALGSGEWVALDSRVAGGRTLRYRRDAGEASALSGRMDGGARDGGEAAR